MLKSVYTKDCPLEKETEQLYQLCRYALGGAIFCVAVVYLLSWISEEPVTGIGKAVAAFMVFTSALFTLMYFLIRKMPDEKYYLASMPFHGKEKAIVWIFSWCLWIPLLVSLYRMKRDEPLKAKQDEERQKSLWRDAQYYMTAQREERFPRAERERLASYCGLQARASSLTMTDEAAEEAVNYVTHHSNVLELKAQSTNRLIIIIRARCDYLGKRYDLGNYGLVLMDDGKFDLVQVRSGRLTNELTVGHSLDNELLAYVKKKNGQIQRYIYLGRVDKAVNLIGARLNDSVCPRPYIPYHVNEHYHLAQEPS